MDHAQYAALFLSESREHIGACNQQLETLKRTPDDDEAIHALFRGMHTIKGMAAMMGYAHVTDLAHRTENLLDRVRGGSLPPSGDLIAVLTEAVDGLDHGIEEAAAGRDAFLDFKIVLSHFDRLGGHEVAIGDTAELPLPGATPVVGRTGRPVRVTVDRETTMPGARAALVLERARGLGTVTGVTPPAQTFLREDFAGTFTFWIDADDGDDALVTALSAVGDIASVTVGEDARPERAVGDRGAVRRAQNMIRVDLQRLDDLMSHVGELVVARNRLVELAVGHEGTELEAVTTRINRLVSDVQTEVIEARMTPVWQVFDRFPRAVRDLARELGKEVSLAVEGGDIEVDRALLDEIGDPILHLLRNAVDHGIESAAERVAAGKPEDGQLAIRCARERDRVVVRIEDDGRGIDREAVLAKAQADGVLDDEITELTDDLLLQVLGRSGFSTAERVTSVSGRGVGIDVVMTRIRGLGGSVEVRSTVGQGTTFTLRLPLTLVIFKALLAGVGPERYVLPMVFVDETVEYDDATRANVHGQDAVVLRDDILTTADLRAVVGLDGPVPEGRRPCVVLEVGERRAALLVDRLLGQQEIVVEPFDPPVGLPRCFSGATILADGTPALILDAAALV